MTPNRKKEVGPEDIRPSLQAFLTAMLFYQGRLVDAKEMASNQLGKASTKRTKRKLQETLQEIEEELDRIKLLVREKQKQVKKGYLHAFD